MLLWKETYQNTTDINPSSSIEEPWKDWPRPPGGFVDIGCGNGLLVHILTTEGYSGYGYDIRSRMSWSHYPEATRENLRVSVFDPLQLDSGITEEIVQLIPPEAFIIANHADELTPWASLMTTLSSASGYISIPCCAWMFDRKFNREQAKATCDILPAHQVSNLNLGEDGSNSSYARYRRWLAAISWQAGWEVECDTLRIPSTRNWAIIGRKMRCFSEECEHPIAFCKGILAQVKENNLWKARSPEGRNAH